MGKIDYRKIYDYNRRKWEGLTDEPEKYEALLAGHYSDSNHFIYELMQNAEDADATKVVIECYEDRLVFYHNGTPFTEEDARGVSSMLMGTKGKDSAQKIGHFGMGFKSVFKYTNIPEIYSDDEAFRIERYLLPVQIEDKWDYNEEKKNIVCHLADGKDVVPFFREEHLTKIVIPFVKKTSSGDEIKLSSAEVMKKLIELDGRILLFLYTIKELYWIEKATGKYAFISLSEAETDHNLVTCRIEGTDYEDKEEISRFLKFSKTFNYGEMDYCNVSVAYRMNSKANNLNPMQNQCIWVYFPTKDETVLPFIIHGSFETAVSREKLMEPSVFNDHLYKEVESLICESIVELKKRGLITQTFIRQIMLPAFKEKRLAGLEQAITQLFLEEALLPDGHGNYYNAKDMAIPVPYTISDFREKALFKATFEKINEDIKKVKAFVDLSDIKGSGFQDYFRWLKEGLQLAVFSLDKWANRLKNYEYKEALSKESEEYSALEDFYNFLLSYEEKQYQRTNYYAYFEENYDKLLKQAVPKAWELLRDSRLVINAMGMLVRPYIDGKPNVYLNSSSKYKRIAGESLVDNDFAVKFKTLFAEGFHVCEFDNYQYIKEKTLKKYIECDDISFEDDDEDKEYTDDLKQILTLLDEGRNVDEIRGILKDAYIIRVEEDENFVFVKPKDAFLPVSDEGLDMRVYLSEVAEEYYIIDTDYYSDYGISTDNLRVLGVYSSVVKPGKQHEEGWPGKPEWTAFGEYCPNLRVDYWQNNILFIEGHPEDEISRKKSEQMLGWALRNYKKFKGQKQIGKVKKEIVDGMCRLFADWIEKRKWIYDENYELREPGEISKFDLNKAVYGVISCDKEAYASIGFITKEQDRTEKALELVDRMERKQQEILLKQLARKFGYSISKEEEKPIEEKEDYYFNIDDVLAIDFPERSVKNPERLKIHVREQFFCSDPTKYEKVLRQIRVSKNEKMVREYLTGMYTNSNDVRICQMCRKQAAPMEATEIANFGIEMEQLHLCLCAGCASKYRSYRDRNKIEFKEAIMDLLLDANTGGEAANESEKEFKVELPDQNSISFTQTHLAELKEIMELLRDYGTPDQHDETEGEIVEEGPLGPIIRKSQPSTVQSEEISPVKTARADMYIGFKNRVDGIITEGVLQPGKYPLHKELEGHKVGDVVKFFGKEYEIVEL